LSIEVNLETNHKKELADLLVAVSSLIRISTNKRVLVVLKVNFQKEDTD